MVPVGLQQGDSGVRIQSASVLDTEKVEQVAAVEDMFAVVVDRIAEVAFHKHRTPAAVVVPDNLRIVEEQLVAVDIRNRLMEFVVAVVIAVL